LRIPRSLSRGRIDPGGAASPTAAKHSSILAGKLGNKSQKTFFKKTKKKLKETKKNYIKNFEQKI
jgi:hypothetical protein